MNATKMNKVLKLSLMTALIVLMSACGRYHRSPVQTAFEKAEKTLGQFARQVAASRYGAVSSKTGLRGTTGNPGFQDICIPGFTVNCGQPGGTAPAPGFGGGGFPQQPYLPDQTAEANKCLQGFQMVTIQGQGQNIRRMAVPALSMLTQCLDRLLVQSSQQLYAFAFSQMGPQSQQYFQFLMDSRGVNQNPSNMGYNTFNDPMMLQYLFGLNGWH